MAQLIVRNLPPAVVTALKRRAAKHGRSAEAEHRALLEEVLLRKQPGSFKAHVLAIPESDDEGDFLPSRDAARRVDL